MNKNPEQNKQADINISNLFNPKKSDKEIYLDTQNEIIGDISGGYKGKVKEVGTTQQKKYKTTSIKLCSPITSQIQVFSNEDQHKGEQRL